VKKALIDTSNCDRAAEVSRFFGGSCVPGAAQPQNPALPGQVAASLCRFCVGDERGSDVCEPNAREAHFGNTGALKCLQNRRGDVAFVDSDVFANMLKGKCLKCIYFYPSPALLTLILFLIRFSSLISGFGRRFDHAFDYCGEYSATRPGTVSIGVSIWQSAPGARVRVLQSGSTSAQFRGHFRFSDCRTVSASLSNGGSPGRAVWRSSSPLIPPFRTVQRSVQFDVWRCRGRHSAASSSN
jgi:hypothetical protein